MFPHKELQHKRRPFGLCGLKTWNLSCYSKNHFSIVPSGLVALDQVGLLDESQSLSLRRLLQNSLPPDQSRARTTRMLFQDVCGITQTVSIIRVLYVACIVQTANVCPARGKNGNSWVVTCYCKECQ